MILRSLATNFLGSVALLALAGGCEPLLNGTPSSDAAADDGLGGGASGCRVLSISPADGATIDSNQVTVAVHFNQPLAALPDGSAPPITLARLAPDGAVAEVLGPNTSWRAEGQGGIFQLTPVGWLAWDTAYRVVVGADTTCADGSTVGQRAGADVTSGFRTPAQAGPQPKGGVFYACQDGGGRMSLRRVGLDGAGDAEVADLGAAFPGGAVGQVLNAMPSPDNQRLVFGAVGADQFTSALLGYDLATQSVWLLSADAVLTSDDTLAQVFDISATGQVAFLGPLQGGQRDQITLTDLDGGGARALLSGTTPMDSLAGLAWTADGARLIVLGAGGSNPGIFEVNATTGEATLKKALNQQALLGLPDHLAYDATSGHVALSFTKNFGTQTQNGELLAWTDLGSAPVFNSATAAINEAIPVFTPGGDRLLFTEYSSTASLPAVAVYDFASAATGPFLKSGGGVHTHALTPDGRTVVYTDTDGQGGTLLLARTDPEAARTLSQTATAQCSPRLAVVVLAP